MFKQSLCLNSSYTSPEVCSFSRIFSVYDIIFLCFWRVMNAWLPRDSMEASVVGWICVGDFFPSVSVRTLRSCRCRNSTLVHSYSICRDLLESVHTTLNAGTIVLKGAQAVVEGCD
jgi:hypothetical protein